MKKATLAAAAAALLGLMGTTFAAQAKVNADTPTTNTEANVTIIGGGFNFQSLDTMSFKDVTLNGTDQTAAATDPDKDVLTLQDYRGTTSGWEVQVSFEQGNELGGGLSLNLAPAADQGTTPDTTMTPIVVNSTPQAIDTLATADTTKPTTNITLNPTITVPAKTKAATYKATIVWNAIDGAPA